MQVILITQSGRRFLSLRLVGWRLWLALALVFFTLLVAVRTGISLGTSEGSPTERLLTWWEASRNDAIARELGGLKAKIDLLESTVTAMDGDSPPAPKAQVKPAADSKPPRMQDLETRLEKISYAIDGIANSRQQLSETLAAQASAKPIEAPISSNFGLRSDPFTGQRAYHRGIDFLAPVGTPIYVVEDGVVESIGPAPGFGKLIQVRHNARLVTRYAHLDGIEVTSGMPVLAGQRIARVGSTGRSTGPHLHLELILDHKAINPTPYLAHLYSLPKRTDSGTTMQLARAY